MFDHQLIKKKQARSKLILSPKVHIDELIFEIYLSIINEQTTKFQNISIVTDNLVFKKKLSSKKVEILTFDELITSEKNSFDLIIIFSDLNFRENIEYDLQVIKLILKKKGLILSYFFSENNLITFKKIIQSLEIDLFDGISQRFHPIIDIRDIGNVFNQLGYNNAVIQRESFSYHYHSLKEFLFHLRRMTFTNALLTNTNHKINKKFYFELEKKFMSTISANITFEILLSCAWRDS